MTNAANAPLGPPLLSVHNLHTHFPQEEGTVKAVDGVSFDLYPGRTLGIVGESGCGKSVTARSILRIVDRPGRIVAGEILFRRRQASATAADGMTDLTRLNANSDDMRAIRGAEIALIFQEPMSSFSPVHTIGNQIVEAILLHQQVSRRQARARAIEVFRHVGIPLPEQRLDAYAHQLSGGLRQRAMIAMGPGVQPQPADRRRADDGVGRHHPGADPRPLAPSAKRNTAWPSCSLPMTSGWSRKWRMTWW